MSWAWNSVAPASARRSSWADSDASSPSRARDVYKRQTYAFVAAGAHGVEFDIHNNPAEALCDGKQAVQEEAGRIIATSRRIHAMLEGIGIETGSSVAVAAAK